MVAGLAISPNNGSGGSDREPREVINATYAGWPLTLSAYSSAEALAAVGGFEPDVAPRVGGPPYRIAGLNVLVEFGPSTQGKAPSPPEARFAAAARELAEALWPVLGPLTQSADEPIPLPAATPVTGDATATSITSTSPHTCSTRASARPRRSRRTAPCGTPAAGGRS